MGNNGKMTIEDYELDDISYLAEYGIEIPNPPAPFPELKDSAPIDNQVGTVVVSDRERGVRCGFIKVPKFGQVYFNSRSEFIDTDFESLTIGTRVKLSVTPTEYGPEASKIKLFPLKKRSPHQESTL